MMSNSEEEKAWRKAAEAGGEVSARRVEELIAALLFKVKKANDRAASSQSRVMSRAIAAIWERFFGKSTSTQASSESSVFFKCVMQGEASGHDIRIVEVSKNVTYEQLSEKLQAKYHRRLVLQFKDADGDQVVLDSEAALKRALLSARNNTVLLFLEDCGDLMQLGAQSMRTSATAALELSPTSSPQRKRRPPQAAEEARVHGGGSATLDFQQSPKRNFSDTSGAVAGATVAASAAAAAPPSSPSAKNWMSGIEQLSTIDRARHLEQVRNNVGLSQEQVEKLRETFLKLSDGEGHVNRYKFSEGLKSLGITNELLIEQNWNAFDDDRDGRVSIAEFLSAISIMSHGSLQQKLRFVFNMYDADGNGTLDKDELLQIFRVTTSLKGEYVPVPQLRRMVEETLKEIDLNGDGKLDFPEFELAIQRNQLEVNTRIAFV
jgi:Ca2+-binding EF-hand superfamily protein